MKTAVDVIAGKFSKLTPKLYIKLAGLYLQAIYGSSAKKIDFSQAEYVLSGTRRVVLHLRVSGIASVEVCAVAGALLIGCISWILAMRFALLCM